LSYPRKRTAFAGMTQIRHMPRKSPLKPDEKPQFEHFIDAAKKVGAAESDEGLPDAIRKMAYTSGRFEKASGLSPYAAPKPVRIAYLVIVPNQRRKAIVS
jgi:hypothetical protein